jgi:hypothetical protein
MYKFENNVVNNLTPLEFYLSQNYPNPFCEKTIIKYCLAYKTKVKLEVFDSESKMIKVLIDEEKEAGTYEIEFDSFDCHFRESGNLKEVIYFYRLEAGDYINEKQMVLKKLSAPILL